MYSIGGTESVYLMHVVAESLRTNSESVFMKFAKRIRLLWIFGLAAASASSGQVQTELHEDFICTSGAVKRVVSVFNRNGDNDKRKLGGCRVDYTKDGKTKTVWSSTTERGYCAAKAASLVTNLVKGNFSCKAETQEQPDDIQPPTQPPAANRIPTH
jgi:hypothetical protein